MSIEVSYNFNSKQKYKFIDEMLKSITKKELLQFYLEQIQPLLKSADGENLYNLYYVGMESCTTSQNRTQFSVEFNASDKGDRVRILFNLFGFIGTSNYCDKLTLSWQKFLARKFGEEYTTLLIQYYKARYDEEENFISFEMDRLQSRLKRERNKYDEIVKEFGSVQVVNGIIDIE